MAAHLLTRSDDDRQLSGTGRVYMVQMDHFVQETEIWGTLGKNLDWDGAFNGIPHGGITLLAL